MRRYTSTSCYDSVLESYQPAINLTCNSSVASTDVTTASTPTTNYYDMISFLNKSGVQVATSIQVAVPLLNSGQQDRAYPSLCRTYWGSLEYNEIIPTINTATYHCHPPKPPTPPTTTNKITSHPHLHRHPHRCPAPPPSFQQQSTNNPTPTPNKPPTTTTRNQRLNQLPHT